MAYTGLGDPHFTALLHRGDNMKNKTILITGATGSFGHYFVKTLLKMQPRKVIVLSRDELKQYEMARELNDERMRFFIGDVRDRDRLRRAFTGVDYVVHAAALKQVETAEYNPFECVKTNIVGGQNVIDAAIDAGVKKVVALSTDKAVDPVGLYGATKLCADKLFVSANVYSPATKFAVVRCGNVIGSRGSVYPLFTEQRADGVVTVTDMRMTRFFMTGQQWVDMVLLALAEMQGGEIFVPKVPSAKMSDIVEAIAPDCGIKLIGVRPGEKLHEAMIGEDEARRTVERRDYYVIQSPDPELEREESNLPEAFVYSSDTNTEWLSVEDLRGFIENRGG